MALKTLANRENITNRKITGENIMLTFSNGLKIVVNLKDWNLNNINAKILAVVGC